jgi:hypothetical protein
MKRRLFALLIAVAMLLLTVPAALAETGTGTAKGFGGDITVSVTVEDGVITAVEAAGDSETDGIRDMQLNGRGELYNLSGQKVENTAKKGLYITKGKKVVIK